MELGMDTLHFICIYVVGVEKMFSRSEKDGIVRLATFSTCSWT